MVVKLFGTAQAPCARRVLACLVEKDIDFEIVPVDISKKDHKKPEFLALQSFGKVPVVQDGDFTMFESRAIIRYYSEKYAGQGTPLLGKNLEERAMVDQWMEVEGHSFNSPACSLVMQLIMLPMIGRPQDLAFIESSANELGDVFDAYEERLSKNKYLAGDFYSLADLTHLPFIHCIVSATDKAYLIRDRQHVNAWWEEISCRPAWKKVSAM